MQDLNYKYFFSTITVIFLVISCSKDNNLGNSLHKKEYNKKAKTKMKTKKEIDAKLNIEEKQKDKDIDRKIYGIIQNSYRSKCNELRELQLHYVDFFRKAYHSDKHDPKFHGRGFFDFLNEHDNDLDTITDELNEMAQELEKLEREHGFIGEWKEYRINIDNEFWAEVDKLENEIKNGK